MKEVSTNAILETVAERNQWTAPTLKILSTQQTEGANFTEMMEGAAKKVGS